MKKCWPLAFAAAVILVAAEHSEAGFAFFGSGTVIVVPKIGTYTTPSFTAPPPLRLRSGTYAWRVRWPGVPFFPVPSGVPLIQDTMSYSVGSPPLTFHLMSSWGFWDPDMIVLDENIRVFELFTAIDDSGPVLTIPLPGNLVEVSDYRFHQESGGFRDLTVADIPTEFEFPTAAPLPPIESLNITAVSIFGNRTETEYPMTVEESTFEGLAARLAELAPGTSYDLTHFDGLSGRVVLAYADVPTKDVIMYAEIVPEPTMLNNWFLFGAVGLAIGWCQRKAPRRCRLGRLRSEQSFRSVAYPGCRMTGGRSADVPRGRLAVSQ